MKTTAQCTKCQHGKVWRVERIGVKDPQYSNGTNIPLQAVDRRTSETFPMPYDGGSVDAYVCAACGYCELHWSGLETLQHNPKAGVHLLTAVSAPPYR